ncbi:MAG: DNA polymerase III subunit gamma/tau [Flavobacteriales bacterium]|nr:DNA polymerase III subunit gamma/tau [Flavobacteriales bacterium]
MGSFVVSARKYRPSSFSTVVGQKSITSTLKNAIKNDHLAQSFLFCGPRGVGKTSCARILAKTVNCFNIAKSENIEACNDCESCNSFNEGHSLNIYELDAASNNSVDGIRSLVDQVRLAPQIGDKKIYIIDEVHMLSQAAFNAFLKTLEEPPEHAMFILATTEKHKIIPTILSRCQIFNFSRIGVNDIAEQLKTICEKESIEAEPRALHTIGQKADGAMRDALSIFDQVVSFAGKNITYDNVIENLNILSDEYFFKVCNAIKEKDVSSSLLTFDEILRKGFDGQHFIVGLANHFRNLLVAQDPSTLNLIETDNSVKKSIFEQSKLFDPDQIVEILNLLNKCDVGYRMSKNQRLHVELCLIFITRRNIVKKKVNTGVITEAPKKELSRPTVESTIPVPEQQTKKAKIQETPVNTGSNLDLKKEEPVQKQSFKVNTPPSVTDRKRKGSVSISNIMNSKAAEDKEGLTEEPETPFTREEFMEAWNDSVEKYKEGGKINLYNTLQKKEPIIHDDYGIEIVINNLVQEESINVEKTELLEELRKKLNNYALYLIITITEAKEEATLYTSMDKFKKLAEKNPKMLELQKKLDLEVTY